jgi:hypothetical protein
MKAVDSWVLDVHVLTYSCFHLLPEADVIEGAIRWYEGGRWPHKQFNVTSTWFNAQAVIARHCCNKRCNITYRCNEWTVPCAASKGYIARSLRILYLAGRLTSVNVAIQWIACHATGMTNGFGCWALQRWRSVDMICPRLMPRTLTINTPLNYRFHVCAFKRSEGGQSGCFYHLPRYTYIDGHYKFLAVAFFIPHAPSGISAQPVPLSFSSSLLAGFRQTGSL